MHKNILALLLIAPLVASCGTHSSASIDPVLGATADVPKAVPVAPRTSKDILITEDDITNRRYRALGDISVTVSKWTVFDADPTPAKVNDALQEKAVSLGADAVVLVRYGTVGMSLFSWGSLDGKGRAVAFEN